VLAGLVIGAATYVTFIPLSLRTYMKVAMALTSLAAWVFLGRDPRLRSQKDIAAAFFSVSLGVLLAQYFGNLPLRFLGLSVSTPQGVAAAKFGEALMIVLPILAVHFATHGSLDGLFLTRGNVKLGLGAGLIGLAVFVSFAALQAKGSGLRWTTIVAALPWILIFIFSNAFMEELWFRALFLKKLQPVVGWPTTLVSTSLVFAMVHVSSTYVIDILLFMVLLMALALLWGWLMRKSNSIWGPVLIHAGGDVLVILGFIAGTAA
jgi:membrane protease YdiL (CAAX protease family)